MRFSTLKFHIVKSLSTRFLCSIVSALFRLIFFVLLIALPLAAQTISGTVTDSQNVPIQNAEVSLSIKNKIIAQTSTNANGEFSTNGIGSENLLLRIRAQGFAVYEKRLSDLHIPITIVLSLQNVQEEVTVSITRNESRLSETPASIVVLDRAGIEQTAAQTVDDTLRQIAGFTLFRRSSSRTTNPTTQGANLRGISGSGAARTSVLFDGVSLNDAFGGWTYWSRVPRAAIENVEVLRGGASAFYGSGGLSGAVNIQTGKSEKPILRFETSAGTQSTFDGSFYAAYGKRGWNFDLALESFRTNGYIPITEEERGAADTNANSRHNTGFLTLARKFNENARIFVRGNLFAERRDNGTRLQNNRTYFRQGTFGADLNNEKFGAFQFRAGIESQVYDQTFSGVSADRNTENLTRIQRVPSQAKTANLFWSRVFGAHTFSAAADAREVRGFSDETIINNNRATSLVSAGGREFSFGVFAQDFWRVTKKLNVNFGGRFDRWHKYEAFSVTRSLTGNQQTTVVNFPEQTENAFSPRISALYQINNNFSVLGSYSKSFRAPTLNELYRSFRVGNVLTLANENLRAERADTFEAGVNFTGFARRLNLRGNVFVTEVSNPIVSITLSSTPALITRQRQNVGETRSHGIELDAEYSIKTNLSFSASYLFVNSRVTNFPANTNLEGKFLPQIPHQQLTFQAFYRPIEKFTFSFQGRISDSQFEDDQNTLRLRAFFTLDVFAGYRLSNKAEIFTAIENIFNNRYDIGLTPNRTVAAPTFARIGLRIHLQ